MFRRRRKLKAPVREKYESESHLCSVFMEEARVCGWEVYPETDEQDMLLVATGSVRGAHFKPGDQIGVQAKLKGNLEVLCQAMPWIGSRKKKGPDFHAVLIPEYIYTDHFFAVAEGLKITVFQPSGSPPDLAYSSLLLPAGRYYRMNYNEKLWVPSVNVKLPAGVKGPRQITEWKISAVELCDLGIERGYLTTKDFGERKVSMDRWLKNRWIVPGEYVVHEGKRMRMYLVNNNHPSTPHNKFPEVVDALRGAGKLRGLK